MYEVILGILHFCSLSFKVKSNPSLFYHGSITHRHHSSLYFSSLKLITVHPDNFCLADLNLTIM